MVDKRVNAFHALAVAPMLYYFSTNTQAARQYLPYVAAFVAAYHLYLYTTKV